MGNTASLNVILNADEPIVAGRTLKGNVLLQGDKSCQGSSIQLKVEGKEVSMIHTTPSYQLRKAEVRFFEATHSIDCSRGKISKCSKYVLPFEIKLPDSLPSSSTFRPSKSSTSFCRKGMSVQYTVTAELGKLRDKIHFQCQSSRASELQPSPKTLFVTAPIRTLLLDRGVVTIAASADTTVLGRSDVLPLRVAIKNDSAVPFSKVRVRLLEHLFWKVDDAGILREERSTVTLDKASFSLPTTVSTPERIKETKPGISFKSNLQGELKHISERSLFKLSRYIALNIPEHARHSYRGTLVNVSHSVEIKIITHKLATSPEVSFDVIIANRCEMAKDFAKEARSGLPGLSPTSSTSGGSMDSFDLLPERQESTSAIFPMSLSESLLSHSTSGRQEKDWEKTKSSNDYEPANTPAVSDVGSDDGCSDSTNDNSLANLVPLPPPDDISVPRLLQIIANTVDPNDLIRQILCDPMWVLLLESLSPSDFKRLVASTNGEQNQIKLVSVLAPLVNRSYGFTVDFAVAAMKGTSEWNRVTLAKNMIPLIIDLNNRREALEEELTEWEQMVLAPLVDDAITRVKQRSSLP